MPVKSLWINVLACNILLSACASGQADSPPQSDIANPVSRVGTLAHDELDEASGVIASAKYPGIFWTHNDGNDGVLYAVRRDGSFVARFKLDAKVHDWED